MGYHTHWSFPLQHWEGGWPCLTDRFVTQKKSERSQLFPQSFTKISSTIYTSRNKTWFKSKSCSGNHPPEKTITHFTIRNPSLLRKPWFSGFPFGICDCGYGYTKWAIPPSSIGPSLERCSQSSWYHSQQLPPFLRRAKQGDEIYRNWQISGSLSKNEKSLHTEIWIYYGYCSKNTRFQTPNQQIFGRKRPFSSFFLTAEEDFSKCDRLISLFCSSFSSPSWTFPKVPALPEVVSASLLIRSFKFWIWFTPRNWRIKSYLQEVQMGNGINHLCWKIQVQILIMEQHQMPGNLGDTANIRCEEVHSPKYMSPPPHPEFS